MSDDFSSKKHFRKEVNNMSVVSILILILIYLIFHDLELLLGAQLNCQVTALENTR